MQQVLSPSCGISSAGPDDDDLVIQEGVDPELRPTFPPDRLQSGSRNQTAHLSPVNTLGYLDLDLQRPDWDQFLHGRTPRPIVQVDQV